jgi:hypothetical protein
LELRVIRPLLSTVLERCQNRAQVPQPDHLYTIEAGRSRPRADSRRKLDAYLSRPPPATLTTTA